MCGRVTLTLDKELIMEILGDLYEVTNTPDLPMVPAYNIGPTEKLLAVVAGNDGYRAGQLTWGLIPHWTKEDEKVAGLINARSETLHEKPAFRQAFERRRCIILADHFFEWRREKAKRVYAFQTKDQTLKPFAGVYNVYRKKDGCQISTCAILTCEPNELMAPIHDRMPVILNENSIHHWLKAEETMDDLKKLFKPYPKDRMTAYEVSSYVNSVRNKGPETLLPISEGPGQIRLDL